MHAMPEKAQVVTKTDRQLFLPKSIDPQLFFRSNPTIHYTAITLASHVYTSSRGGREEERAVTAEEGGFVGINSSFSSLQRRKLELGDWDPPRNPLIRDLGLLPSRNSVSV